ncbi:ABC transporter ATP-binding protein [Canibacter zhoujuaniae]|uniref:ABC transporter ATP-binding protein n=1 Tax=Canibacter zhoujuaniae TaxID=2708343 RepID=UPI001423B291|nr:ABC transporter ATP-binding protein [Canibacter zhoujuaniae]
MSKQQQPVEPSKRDRLKPVELLVFSAIIAVFASAVVAMATKDFRMLVPVTFIATFIVTLMVVALLGLSAKPNAEDELARKALEEMHRNEGSGHHD